MDLLHPVPMMSQVICIFNPVIKHWQTKMLKKVMEAVKHSSFRSEITTVTSWKDLTVALYLLIKVKQVRSKVDAN